MRGLARGNGARLPRRRATIVLAALTLAASCGGELDAGPDEVADGGPPALGDGGPGPDTPGGPARDAAPDGAPRAVAPVTREATYEVEAERGVVYGTGLRRSSWTATTGEEMDLTLDVYRPVGETAPNKPALVCIHGGGFASGLSTHAPIVSFARYHAARGWVTFSLNYRLAGDYGSLPSDWPDPPQGWNQNTYRATYPAARDTKAALRFIHAHAAEYGIDEGTIAVMGASAGAYLAVMAGAADAGDYRDEVSAAEDPTLAGTHLDARADVSAVIDLWGGVGLLDALELYDGRARVDAADAPLSIAHGRGDTTVEFAQAEELRAAWQAAGVPVDFHPFDGGHAAWDTIIDGKTLEQLAFDFLVARQGLEVR